jgi:hypothetical protein
MRFTRTSLVASMVLVACASVATQAQSFSADQVSRYVDVLALLSDTPFDAAFPDANSSVVRL